MSQKIEVTYLLTSPPEEVNNRAEAVLLEQTVELSRAAVEAVSPQLNLIGEVQELREASELGGWLATLQQPLESAGNNCAQLLNVLFGNSSLQPDVQLYDVALPDIAADFLPGPPLGADALRELANAPNRPMTMTALKPMGLSIEEIARLAGLFAEAGIDIIKDDHGLADHDFCRFDERIRRCAEAIAAANERTGGSSVYAPNLIGGPSEIKRQLDETVECGINAIMLEPMLVGLPLMAEIATQETGQAIIAHPAFGGALRMSPELMVGKLFRWYGADAVIFPNFGGRFSYSKSQCQSIANHAMAPHPRWKKALPVPAGGISFNQVDEVLDFFGQDVILLMGGSLYSAGDLLAERAAEFVQRTRKKFN